jgi:hypothetical protein
MVPWNIGAASFGVHIWAMGAEFGTLFMNKSNNSLPGAYGVQRHDVVFERLLDLHLLLCSLLSIIVMMLMRTRIWSTSGHRHTLFC